MKFLAIDTSGKHLSVAVYAEGAAQIEYLRNCAMKHSVILMDEIDAALLHAHIDMGECDFFAAVVGPGSFTGIRIGISTVKGMCFACGKPALAVTSFDCIAYDEKSEGKILALSDAGRGEFYACGYEGRQKILAPCILSREEVEKLREQGYGLRSAEELTIPCERANVARGLLSAALAGAGEAGSIRELHALYLRKSSAEEQRK